MKKRITVKGMVKEIFFAATEGRRSADNFLEGSIVLDHVGYFYYRSWWERKYDAFTSGKETARVIMGEIARDLRLRGLDFPRCREVAKCIEKVMYA